MDARSLETVVTQFLCLVLALSHLPPSAAGCVYLSGTRLSQAELSAKAAKFIPMITM